MNGYRRWVIGMVSGVLVILALCATVVYVADPCFFYRYPGKLAMVFFNERYQSAGIAKNDPAGTVLLGTSMVANYRISHVEENFAGKAVKLSIPDGYLSEFDDVMAVVWRNSRPKRVIFGLDINILVRDESEKTNAMPEYLYDRDPLNDVSYLLNKDTLYYSVYRKISDSRGTGESENEAFTWDGEVGWSKVTALAGYERPQTVSALLPGDAYAQNVSDNLAVIESWVTQHPETQFDIFFPPYSILYWDKERRLGNVEAVFGALRQAADQLLTYDNVKLYFFPADQEIVTNLNNYADYIHHSGQVCQRVLSLIQTGDYQMTPETTEKILTQWREFVVNYDYEAIWADGAQS